MYWIEKEEDRRVAMKEEDTGKMRTTYTEVQFYSMIVICYLLINFMLIFIINIILSKPKQILSITLASREASCVPLCMH